MSVLQTEYECFERRLGHRVDGRKIVPRLQLSSPRRKFHTVPVRTCLTEVQLAGARANEAARGQ